MLVSCVVACLCSIVRGSSAGLLEFPDFWYLETFNAAAGDHSEPDHDHSHQLVLHADQPVVTAVDLRGDLRLRAATEDETKRCEEIVEPIVLTSSRRRNKGPQVTSRRVATPTGNKRQAESEIRRVVNKFVMNELYQSELSSTNIYVGIRRKEKGKTTIIRIDEKLSHKSVSATEVRGQELIDAIQDENDPTVKVFFKGDYSVVTIACERRVWNFVIRPPSPLPNWFYSDHVHSAGTGPSMDIPEDVQKDFYVTLLRLLKVFLRFDL